MDAREKREAERRAAGEVDEDEEEDASAAATDSGAATKESTPEKPGKENQVCDVILSNFTTYLTLQFLVIHSAEHGPCAGGQCALKHRMQLLHMQLLLATGLSCMLLRSRCLLGVMATCWLQMISAPLAWRAASSAYTQRGLRNGGLSAARHHRVH